MIRTFLEDSGRQYDGHAASINEVAFSHDERRVASCSSDKTIKLWDPLDGNMVFTMYGHADEVMGVNFSHDGMFLVSCGLDNLVIVWNLTNGAILKKVRGLEERNDEQGKAMFEVVISFTASFSVKGGGGRRFHRYAILTR